jgi:hypothetical protein
MSAITIPQAPPLKVNKIKVYSVECGTQEERMANLCVLLSSFRGRSSSDEIAVSKMISILILSIPEMEKYLTNNSAPIDIEMVKSDQVLDLMIQGKGPAKEDPDDWASSSVDPECVLVTNQKAVYAAAAVAFMTYAKSAGESSRTALEAARPSAMSGKYGLTGDDTNLFPGSAWGPEIENLEQVNIGFTLYPRLRYLVTAFFISVQSARTFPPPNVDPFVLIFSMLKNVGLTHVGAIVKLIEMHPWVLQIPSLAPDLKFFADELKQSLAVQPNLRPYHRLLVPQAQFLFVSANMRPLIAVAGDFVKEVESTFGNYESGRNTYAKLIQQVRDRAPLSERVPDINNLARLFDVAEIEPGPEKVESVQSTKIGL